MATNVSYQPDGFFVRGVLSGWNPDLDGLANFMGVRQVIWLDKAHTALFVACDNPQRSAEHMLEILKEYHVANPRQDVTFVPLDATMTAVVFEHHVPANLHAVLAQSGVGTVLRASSRTALFVHATKDDETALAAEQAAWAALCDNDIAGSQTDAMLRSWPTRRIGQDLLIELDESTVAVLIKSAQHVSAALLKNEGINFVQAGSQAVLLAAGESPKGDAQEPGATERPSPFAYRVGLARSLHALSEMVDGLRFDPPPATMTI